jgi:protein-S-isoprenylcysteine O-methyltransferase Ste14
MDRGTIWRVWLPLIAGLWALVAIFRFGPGPHGAARWVGLAVGMIGLTGVIVACSTLGRSFSLAAKATALVTRGIYSRIRNPIYISDVIFLIGLTVMMWVPSLLLLLIVIIPMQIIRARREARVLEEEFGDEYREYRKRTWF